MKVYVVTEEMGGRLNTLEEVRGVFRALEQAKCGVQGYIREKEERPDVYGYRLPEESDFRVYETDFGQMGVLEPLKVEWGDE